MIPRTKVNYRIKDLVRAIFVGERRTTYRDRLVRRLAQLFGTPDILLTGSGRGALYLLFRALPQPKVLVPAYTCQAVVEAALLAGKELLYGELEEGGFNMDSVAVESQLGPHVIVVATHQFGIPCDIHRLLRSSRAKGAFVLEDAAAALGTRIDGRLAGSFGDAAIFSFDSTKLVNVPLKAGFLTARDPGLLDRCRQIQSAETTAMGVLGKWRYLLLGSALVLLENPYLYRIFHNLKFRWRDRFTDDAPMRTPVLGDFFRHRMAEWQAAVAESQIADLERIVEVRRRLYAALRERLSGAHSFSLPPEDERREWACIRFPIRMRKDKLGYYRQASEAGLDFAFSFTFIAAPQKFERSHRLAAQVLDLPFYLRLTPEELSRTVDILNKLDRDEAFHGSE